MISHEPGTTDVDAVVIGAGHNGLVAANLLADAGSDVLVLEAADRPGGAVFSDDTLHPVFTTDWYSSYYPLAAASPVIASLDLEKWGLEWRHAPSVLVHLFPDGRCAVLSRDVTTTAGSLDEFADGDAADVREWVSDLKAAGALLGHAARPR